MSSRSERAERKKTLAALPGPSACSYGSHSFCRVTEKPWGQEGTHLHSCAVCGAVYQQLNTLCQCKPALDA